MLARRGDVVARRKLLDDLDVGDESGPREDPLEEVVTEQGVLGDPAGERRFEHVDVVDALAGVRAFPEQILIHVGDGERVRVQAAGAREHPLEERAFWLTGSDGVTRGCSTAYPSTTRPVARIQPRTIERMRHFSDQALRRSAWQARVGVQRDHVPNRGRWNRDGAADRHKGGVGRAAQPAIQLVQLPPLAFPADPRALTLVPEPPPMKQEETRRRRRPRP